MNPFEPSPIPEGDDSNAQQPQPPAIADGSGAGDLLEGGADLAGGALEGLGGCAEGCAGCSLAILAVLFGTAGTALALFR